MDMHAFVPLWLSFSCTFSSKFCHNSNNKCPSHGSEGLNRVKLYDTDATILTAFANSGIKVVVAMPNELLSNAVVDQSFTDALMQANISNYYPVTKSKPSLGATKCSWSQQYHQVPRSGHEERACFPNQIQHQNQNLLPIILSVLQTSFVLILPQNIFDTVK